MLGKALRWLWNHKGRGILVSGGLAGVLALALVTGAYIEWRGKKQTVNQILGGLHAELKGRAL